MKSTKSSCIHARFWIYIYICISSKLNILSNMTMKGFFWLTNQISLISKHMIFFCPSVLQYDPLVLLLLEWDRLWKGDFCPIYIVLYISKHREPFLFSFWLTYFFLNFFYWMFPLSFQCTNLWPKMPKILPNICTKIWWPCPRAKAVCRSKKLAY